jgi:hypothetical protein
MEYFDYKSVASEANIPDGSLAEICRIMRQEFPGDEMMFELHVLRACLAVRDGLVSLADVLRGESPTPAH